MDYIEHMGELMRASAALESADTLESSADPRLPKPLKERLPEAAVYANQQMRSVALKLSSIEAQLGHELTALTRSRRSYEAKYDALLAVTEKLNAWGPPPLARKVAAIAVTSRLPSLTWKPPSLESASG